MTIEQLRTIHRAMPFRPFMIHLVDGRQYAVPRPEFLSNHPSGKTVLVFHEDDSVSFFDLALVNEVEFHQAGTGQDGPLAER